VPVASLCGALFRGLGAAALGGEGSVEASAGSFSGTTGGGDWTALCSRWALTCCDRTALSLNKASCDNAPWIPMPPRRGGKERRGAIRPRRENGSGTRIPSARIRDALAARKGLRREEGNRDGRSGLLRLRMMGSRAMARPVLDFATLAVGTSGERRG